MTNNPADSNAKINTFRLPDEPSAITLAVRTEHADAAKDNKLEMVNIVLT